MADAVENPETVNRGKYSKLYIGSSGPSVWREGMEVANPISEGLSARFYLFDQFTPNLHFSFQSRISPQFLL